jgi:creatinine amidohydrolase/Fe(II)-dependent formamide hydrolase-like protein
MTLWDSTVCFVVNLSPSPSSAPPPSPPHFSGPFFSAPGSVFRATASGTWGDARASTAEFGERYLEVVTGSTIRLLDDIERTFQAMPGR